VSRAIAKVISAAAHTTLALALGLGAAPAADALAFTPCPTGGGFSCTTLTVPLNRGGGAAGAVTLSVERLQSGGAPSEDAVVALAGGPGQAAIPVAGDLANTIAPALVGRDLIVFDQRGTGSSGPLACSALEGEGGIATIGLAFERCAMQIGAGRGSYTTQESVADIESLRQALGYRRLVLFGVSYGTKVALEYAERYPQSVEALVLDSVVPPERQDPFQLATFAAMPGAFSELCSLGACAGITVNPVGDLARLSSRLRRHALSGYVYDGAGKRHRVAMSDVALLNLVAAGDLNPALRALLPASVTSALRGDSAPLLRLNLLSRGVVPNVPGTPTAATGSGGVDEALFVDTTCEEQSFPWRRDSPVKTRLHEALGALHALPAGDFYPFDASVEWAGSILPGCAAWPNLAPPPLPVGTLPRIPSLILSGTQDLRTPTSGAEAVAARIAGAQLLKVPYTGHSVLGSDFSGCAQEAVKGFFSGASVQSCKPGRNLFAPTPVTPTRLAYVKPVGGVHGQAGSTLTVALETILDLERQVVGATLQAEQQLPSGASFGGLRGGYARIGASSLLLHRLSFVPGVELTGAFQIVKGKLRPSTVRVEGKLASRGSLRIGGPTVTGTLGGVHLRVSLAKVRLASAGADIGRWSAAGLALDFPSPGLVGRR
jgi:pimeloyl-ACP methyl ester carboxylesterase